MPAYKDKAKGTWYASFYYEDWTGKKVKKMKRGFPTKREALEWECQSQLKRYKKSQLKKDKNSQLKRETQSILKCFS